MTHSPETLHAVYQIDRDRRSIENAGITIATRLASQALRHAITAARFGQHPANATRAVLLGSGASEHATATDILARVMLIADLKGRRRSILNARLGISLARADQKLDDEYKFLLALLLLSEAELEALIATYREMAGPLIKSAADPLLERLGDVIEEAQRRFGESPTNAQIRRQIREDYGSTGWLSEDAFTIENIFRTAGVRAYEAGRDSGWRKPEIADALFGFRFVAVLDDRTTHLCRSLDGTIAPKDDPFWKRWTPPNHFHCRSARVEVWRSESLNEPARTEIGDLEQFAAEKQRFLSYF